MGLPLVYGANFLKTRQIFRFEKQLFYFPAAYSSEECTISSKGQLHSSEEQLFARQDRTYSQ
jgi:hypothetical protein